MEPLSLFLVTLTRNIKYQEIFKLNSLNHIFINSSNWPYTVLQLPKLWPCLGQLQATPMMSVVQWWQPTYGMPRKDKYRIYAELLQLHPSRWREPHPVSYQGCSHAKELQRKKAQ
jgi:hypothetical protein